MIKTLNVPLETMPRREVTGLVNRLREEHADEVVLIVSSARTIPKILKALGHNTAVRIRWDEYDTLFIIEPDAQGGSRVTQLRLDGIDGARTVGAVDGDDDANSRESHVP